MTAPARGGEGGEGGEGGGGGGRGGRGGGREGEGTGFWCSPLTDSPNPLEAAKLHRRTLGLIYGFTQRHPPPPPPRWPFCGVGVSGEGIKRWGIEGIRIGTSDRFGRGRGELLKPAKLQTPVQHLTGHWRQGTRKGPIYSLPPCRSEVEIDLCVPRAILGRWGLGV